MGAICGPFVGLKVVIGMVVWAFFSKERPNRHPIHYYRELDNIVEEAQAKSTKYSTKYAVKVFQAKFCI